MVQASGFVFEARGVVAAGLFVNQREQGVGKVCFGAIPRQRPPSQRGRFEPEAADLEQVLKCCRNLFAAVTVAAFQHHYELAEEKKGSGSFISRKMRSVNDSAPL